MKYFEAVQARLLKDHHPEGYEDEWHNAGKTVWVQLVPPGTIYMAKWSDGRNMSWVFNSNAVEGVDFELIPSVSAPVECNV